MTLQEKRAAALALLSDDAKLALNEWLKAESAAWMDGTREMPSYTHPECGAEHALDDIAEAVLGES
jgi:hypothetical protein